MRALTILKLRLRTLLQSRRLDRELEEELQYHLDRQIQRNRDAGMSTAEAREAAIRSMGRATQVQEQCRDERRVAWITGSLRDFQSGLRTLRRTPGFAALVVITLGLGIGANSAVFSVADALLFKALPVPQPERLFQVLQPDGPGLKDFGELFAPDDFAEMSGRVAPFATLAAETEGRPVEGSFEGRPEEPIRRQAISGNYFAAIGVQPAIGATISDAESAPAQTPAAVISFGFWKRRFGADPAILGQTIRIGKTVFQIIGVSQPEFFGTEIGSATDVWTPLTAEPKPSVRARSVRSIRLIGRLAQGATLAQVFDPLQTVLHRQMTEMVRRAPAGTPQSLIDRILQLKLKLISAGGGISPLRNGSAAPLIIVFGLVGLVLLLACVTVATLFEARRSLRQGEMAVRLSLGASRWRLLRQLLCEAMLLAGAAAGFGLILARWMIPALTNLLAASGGSLEIPAALNGRVLAFTAVVGILTALMFGLLPAWRSSGLDPSAALGSSGRNSSRRSHAGKALVILQMSVSVALVVGAMSFVRTLINLSTANTGFDRRNVIVANVQFRGTDRSERLSLAWKELQRRVAAIPGVESASLSSGSPFDGAYGNGMLRIPGAAPKTNQGCIFFLISAGFFETTGIARIEGRDFEPRDFGPGAPPVALISEGLARQLFPGISALGRTFSNFEDSPPRWVTVIGVVGDTRFENLRNSPPRIVYLPYTWPHSQPAMSVVIRARRDVGSMRAELAREAGLANPEFAVRQVVTQTKLIDDTLVRERLLAKVASFFGALALLLAIVGLYGITSYTVAQRTPEIGIRMALGAAQARVLAMILRESAAVAAAGAAIGFAVSLAAGSLISAFLFGVKTYDAGTLATVACFPLVVTFAAALIPARRAARTDPMTALRHE